MQTHEIEFLVLVILPDTNIPSIWECSNSCIWQGCSAHVLTWSHCWNKFAQTWSWTCNVI
jgi:hypothetical protein